MKECTECDGLGVTIKHTYGCNDLECCGIECFNCNGTGYVDEDGEE